MADSMARDLAGAFFGPNRRNGLVLAVVVGLVAMTVFVPHWAARYGGALALFCIWMAWFVETLATWLGEDG